MPVFRIELFKCEFFSPRITYLGHVVDKDGSHPRGEKIKAIADPPRSDRGLTAESVFEIRCGKLVPRLSATFYTGKLSIPQTAASCSQRYAARSAAHGHNANATADALSRPPLTSDARAKRVNAIYVLANNGSGTIKVRCSLRIILFTRAGVIALFLKTTCVASALEHTDRWRP
ncbi:hypothetical protein EVAR_68203_1 [Eumeta japonica]|uniref:Uncharacterized protein n=1 Tax=Eumeta variegata TaxID=151549 RepID=A0A4C2A2Z2_EUMVA|nr:hypothetical protein EVAR_68203_1 [Eumeta japonica]